MEQLLFHALSAHECYKKLETTSKGLASKEAEIRLKKYGPNALADHTKLSALGIFVSQFANPLVYILFAAAVISAFTKDFVDMGIIIAVIAISSVVGFIQEYKANHSLEELKTLIAYHALVQRDGIKLPISSKEVVPGDMIFLEAGEKVPADIRLTRVLDMEVIESALTGESTTSVKNSNALLAGVNLAERSNMAYLGTIIAKGKAEGVVVSTGAETELGKISKLLQETKEDISPLEKQIRRLGQLIGIFLIGLATFLFGFGILLQHSWLEMFLVSVAVLVAAIPEGILPALTVILAVGMKRIHKNNGLIRKMVSAETLGSVSVICSDKTGTLTSGVMQVSEILTGKTLFDHRKNDISNDIEKEAQSHSLALKIGVLCNNALVENPHEDLDKQRIIGSPVEKALFISGSAFGLNKDSLEKNEPRVSEIPFDADYKFMATMHHREGHAHFIYVKGAPEKLLALSSFLEEENQICPLRKTHTQHILRQQKNLSAKGLHVLAVAYKIDKTQNPQEHFHPKTVSDLTFVGLIGLRDPLRETAKESVALCRSAGIHIVMVTGDHHLTAIAIGKEIGLRTEDKNVLEGNALDALSDQELARIIKTVDIYARVAPKHKIRIVEAWQNAGHIVGMTGDGVNDAPALKRADIGIALGSGTDVAKETSDLVLLDDNFSTIVTAIKRGRIIFDNIRKVIVYLMCDSFTELTLLSGTLLINMFIKSDIPLPLIPAQILWIKIAEDAAPAMALAFDDIDENVMRDPPRKHNEPILPHRYKAFILFYSIIMDITLFLLFLYIWKTTHAISFARTFAFAGLGFSSFFFIFSARSLKTHIFALNPFQNRYVLASAGIGMLFLLIAIYVPFFHTNILFTTPFGIFEWGILFVYTAQSIFIFELGKRIFLMKNKRAPH
ncbi:MAG: Calcium-translocating P-type ATPase, PMCA-type [Parcubacteria group bacterium GW2011_GWA2_44_12]|nr:MAG: Calcium-translocating P-type ATPase, PMCA-type [Parcubacteria group bacterium GW2011_GWA2_44_12]